MNPSGHHIEFNKLPGKSEHSTFRYAGIGSRNVPEEKAAEMTAIAQELELLGFTLITGDADGSDKAFRDGANKKEVYTAKDATDLTRTIAKEIHPAPYALKGYALNLMARNTNQIFGKKLNEPVDFVLCWTPNGEESYEQRTIKTGGTGQAIEMASRKEIPVINMANAGWREKLQDILMGILTTINDKKI